MQYPHPGRSYLLPEIQVSCHGCTFLRYEDVAAKAQAHPHPGVFRCKKLALPITTADENPEPLKPGCKRYRG